jgi:hypothetical protein
VEEQLRSGHPDIEGLSLALMDWSAELRLIEVERLPESGRTGAYWLSGAGGKAR